MEIANVFYIMGIVFLLVTIGYFVGTYLQNIPSLIKSILAFMLAIILFILGDYLRERNI